MQMLATAAAKLKCRSRHGRSMLPSLWLLTDEKRLPDPIPAARALPRGAAVVLRHYGAKNRRRLATQLAQICRRRGLMLLLADDWRLAAAVGAQGLHLPEASARRGIPCGARLWRRSSKKLVTTAVHGPGALRRAQALEADAALLGPVFATPTHPGRRTLGRALTAAWVRDAALPVIALGGVNASTLYALNNSGVAGIAGIGFATG